MPSAPSWDDLFRTAAAQDGHFTTVQAAEAGYSPQLLAKYLSNGRVKRIRRGVYRLVHFPAGEREDLAVLWLWSDRAGVYSHDTALAMHELSDAMPSRIHMTLPAAWKQRRLRVPAVLDLHFRDLSKIERTWIGTVPVTAPLATLQDCADAHLQPDLLRQAIDQGVARGLFSRHEVADVARRLRLSGGRRRTA